MQDSPEIRPLSQLAIAAAIGDVAMPYYTATLQQGYSHTAQWIDELAAPGLPGADVLSGWWMISGLLIIAFARITHLGTPMGKIWWAGPLGLAVYGVSSVGAGVFPSGPLHHTLMIAGAVARALTPAGFLLRWRSVGVPWRLLRWDLYAAAASLIALAALAMFGWRGHGEPGSVAGLLQRACQGIFYLWVIRWAAMLSARSTR